MIHAIIVSEGEFSGLVYFNSPDHFDLFNRGLQKGCELYGGGSCYMLTRDDIDNADIDDDDRALIKKHLLIEKGVTA